MPAKSRLTVNIETDMPGLPPGPVATQVLSDAAGGRRARAGTWPLTPDRWIEAHNSFGVTEPAMKWGLAEGRAGGAEQYQTFILLANPGDEPATVTLAFLADGASPAPANRTIVVPAQRRVTVPAEAPEPSSTVTTFGTLLIVGSADRRGAGDVLECRRPDMGCRHERHGDAPAVTLVAALAVHGVSSSRR